MKAVTTETIRWGAAERGEPFGCRHSLQEHASGALGLSVDRSELALVIDGEEVVAALFEGEHLLQVLAEGEDRGDIGPAQRARRLGIDIEDLDLCERRCRWVRAHQQIQFVNVGEFGVDEVDVRSGGRRAQVLYRLAVTDPWTFFDSFLRATGDLSPHDFRSIVGGIVSGALEPALGQGEDFDPRALLDSSRAVLVKALQGLGLGVVELQWLSVRPEVGSPGPRVHEPGAMTESPVLATGPGRD